MVPSAMWTHLDDIDPQRPIGAPEGGQFLRRACPAGGFPQLFTVNVGHVQQRVAIPANGAASAADFPVVARCPEQVGVGIAHVRRAGPPRKQVGKDRAPSKRVIGHTNRASHVDNGTRPATAAARAGLIRAIRRHVATLLSI